MRTAPKTSETANRRRLGRAERGRDAREPDAEDDQPRHDVHRLPDPYLAHAHEDLRVLGLRQREVELPVANVLDEPRHVRLDVHLDRAAHEDLHAEDAEELRLRPSVQLVRVRVDEREHDEAGHQRDRRLHERDEEVHAVLQLVQDSELQEEPADADRVHQPPTAEYRLIADRHATRKIARPMRIQRSWTKRPWTSSWFDRSPTRLSIGK